MSSMPPTSTTVLCWPKRLLSADDLRRHLTSQRELLLLPRTVITPLAADELRAKGVRVSWQVPPRAEATAPKPAGWIFAQEKSDAMVASALQALEREGLALTHFPNAEPRAFAEAIRANNGGGVLFTGDPALACCIANKIVGIRAAAVAKMAQVVRARTTLAANLYAIEIPGPTLFEIRQMVRTIVADRAVCPEMVAKTLQELDGHAHR